jgi:hypothetical protein
LGNWRLSRGVLCGRRAGRNGEDKDCKVNDGSARVIR